MVRILKSINDKVTVELTLEELSAVENDLDVHLNHCDLESDSHPATIALVAEIEAYWTGLPPSASNG